MRAPLIDTTPVCYLGNDLRVVWRPCRIWRLGEDKVLAVVTETLEPSMSIETAADPIRDFLEWIWKPFQVASIVEHWPDGIGADKTEHYAEQYRQAGRIHWRHVDVSTLSELLADFESSKPSPAPLPEIPIARASARGCR